MEFAEMAAYTPCFLCGGRLRAAVAVVRANGNVEFVHLEILDVALLAIACRFVCAGPVPRKFDVPAALAS
jgi:hypothetical protein